MKRLNMAMLIACLLLCACGWPGLKEHTTADRDAAMVQGLDMTEQDVIDCYIYILARYLVIRQEHIDLAEDGVDYNTIKYNELGKAEFVNPNLDVAYLEAWFAVDENTPVILQIPKIENRYYTAQIMDEWAEILYNIHERNFPETPYGKFALVLKGSHPAIPDDAVRIEIPSKKTKMLARVERKGDDEGAVRLQMAFKIIKLGEPEIAPAVDIPEFTNEKLITVDAFRQPTFDRVIGSASDSMKLSAAMGKKARAIAAFVNQSETNKALIETVITQKALPAFAHFLKTMGDARGGWIATTGKLKGFGEDYWFRTAANYAGIWWNNNEEAVYFVGSHDAGGEPLNGDNVYVLHFKSEDLPDKHVNAYWSLTMLNLPDYRVVPNRLDRFNFNNRSRFTYEKDGSLKLYLSGELPKGAPESNWLPAPKGGKLFSMTMRLYVPKAEVLSGAYYLPPIKKLE
ncbi:DUF1214 domain-containing protein [uncultured Desulfosarcina sp.]|uniref:DUF1214 domain-containing protein n=1 Tax=uncultured Desulfosarcina sp. TaxID=218289 RepID=UPI0029C61392|nr:DUF1214 domain-containing protein [uncultured Desulfosarcina sp.]